MLTAELSPVPRVTEACTSVGLHACHPQHYALASSSSSPDAEGAFQSCCAHLVLCLGSSGLAFPEQSRLGFSGGLVPGRNRKPGHLVRNWALVGATWFPASFDFLSVTENQATLALWEPTLC